MGYSIVLNHNVKEIAYIKPTSVIQRFFATCMRVTVKCRNLNSSTDFHFFWKFHKNSIYNTLQFIAAKSAVNRKRSLKLIWRNDVFEIFKFSATAAVQKKIPCRN